MRINLQQRHRGRAAAAEHLELTGRAGSTGGAQQDKELCRACRATRATSTATTAGARATTKAGATTTRPSADREGGRTDGG